VLFAFLLSVRTTVLVAISAVALAVTLQRFTCWASPSST
jgi:hypothetical protein